jgi:hypothetical protein
MTADAKTPKASGPYGGHATFDEWAAARPDLFELDFDCRPPGESNLSDEYRDSLIPDHMRQRVMASRRAERAAKGVKR